MFSAKILNKNYFNEAKQSQESIVIPVSEEGYSCKGLWLKPYIGLYYVLN